MLFQIDNYIKLLKESNNVNLFQQYIDANISASFNNYSLLDNVCVCHAENDIIHIIYTDNNDVINTVISNKNRRKLYNIINNYQYVISNFAIDKPNKDVITLREEVIDNYLFCNYRYYLDTECILSKCNHEIYLFGNLFNKLTSNIDFFEQIIFDSTLLNTFIKGLTVDDIIIKPKINISQYGRWYWSNTDKFQTNITERNKVYSKLSKSGIIVNIDLVSGEPIVLAKLAHSKLLKKFVDYRISLKDKDDEMRNILKKFINIFIHSYPTVNSVYQTVVKTVPNYQRIESIIGIPLDKIIEKLFAEFIKYNNKIVETYKNTLEYTELQRRIVNPLAPIMSDAQIIKEHRKYMQGHTHDLVLKYAYMNNKKFSDIYPIFTIHDCLSYFIQDTSIIDEFIKTVKYNAKALNIPINLEIRQRSSKLK